MHYDVIVVGAGPGGSTAARECASRGLSVLILDRAAFPRDKPCGGGVNVRAARLLPFDLTPVVERTINSLAVSVRQGPLFVRRTDRPLSFLTQRRDLDAYLLDQARRAGASVREKAPVREIALAGSHVEVRTGSETFRAGSLVGADGANGPTARLTGLRQHRWMGIALEANVTPRAFPEEWQDAFAIDVGLVPGGYGWLFPKGDHLNIGVGGWSSAGPGLRALLDSMTRFYGHHPSGYWGLRGHPLPVRRPGSRLAHRNVLLVGDAAGLLDPLSGEGIYSAIWSGATAARHIADYLDGKQRGLEPYEIEVGHELIPELDAAVQLRDLFHAAPRLWTEILRRSPFVWQAVCRLLRGDLTYTGVKRRSPILRGGIDAGAELVRLAVYLSRKPSRVDTMPPGRLLPFRRAIEGPGRSGSESLDDPGAILAEPVA